MKALGLFIVSAIPMALGFFWGAELEKAARIREALLSFLRRTRDAIARFQRSQEDIFLHYENAVLERIGFLPRLRKEVSSRPFRAMERSLLIITEETRLGDGEKKALLDFGKNFGLQSLKAQISDLDSVISLFEEAVEKERRDLPSRIRLARVLGVTVGMGIYIMLV